MAQIIHAKDLRPGHTFLFKNNLYLVLENSFNKTAMREGIVKCKVCGHNMVRRPFGNGVNDTFICPVSGCPNVGSNLNVVEKKLLYNIKTILKQYEKYLDDCANKENDVDYITIVNGIKKEISESENQLLKSRLALKLP